MKTSRIAAKVAVRLLLILILLAMVPFFTGNGWDKQLNQVHFILTNKWVLVYPILIILGFISLFILSARQKYSKPDVNWLLVINTLVLIAYGITFYIKLFKLLH